MRVLFKLEFHTHTHNIFEIKIMHNLNEQIRFSYTWSFFEYMLADLQKQSLDESLINIQKENISDVTQVSFNTSNKIICPNWPIHIEDEGEAINWNMVAKGIALSMGQGIVIQTFKILYHLIQDNRTFSLLYYLILSLWNKSHGGIYRYQSWCFCCISSQFFDEYHWCNLRNVNGRSISFIFRCCWDGKFARGKHYIILEEFKFNIDIK